VCNVALPELPGETLHVTDHGILEFETRVPAQRSISKHPVLGILGHENYELRRIRIEKLYDVRRVSVAEEVYCSGSVGVSLSSAES
jgi:hypothetical protein